MVSPRSGSGRSSGNESVACDFCSEQVAVLYCRADSGKLCLLCDQHVHSANLLSRKHLRSQICDNCNAEPVSFRCSTENLFLCHDCDWGAHATSSVAFVKFSFNGKFILVVVAVIAVPRLFVAL